jgi:hypothetical protein
MRTFASIVPLLIGILASTAAAAPRPLPPTSGGTAGADDCANASQFPISGTGTFTVDTTGATDSPQIGAGCAQARRDVWFEYTATFTGTLKLTTCGGTSANTVVAAWSGATCPSGTPLACNDNACNLQSRITFPVTNGGVYLLQIGVASAGTFVGTFELAEVPPAPVNDDCATPVAITGLGTFPFENEGATTGAHGQTESPCLHFTHTAITHDVWFTWTAPSTGLATFETCLLTAVDTKIAVYPGAGCPTAGSVLACNEEYCGHQSSVDFDVVAGEQYTLQIGGFPGTLGGAGSFSLDVFAPPGPPTPASINVDIGSPAAFPAPSDAYGGAAAQPGFWNARSASVAHGMLNDLTGSPCQAVLTSSFHGVDFAFDNAGTTGDDQALMDDAQDVNYTGPMATWTFSNLFGGSYVVYTYAWAPDNANFQSLVTVAGSPDSPQIVGGPWPGAHVLGVTYARHRARVASGGSLAITIEGPTDFGTLNGFQLVREESPFAPYCFGDGTGTPCPCGNAGAPGNGCAHSLDANGANLSASGIPSLASDTVVLLGTGMPDSTCLYFQGTTSIAAVFGDGLRCAAGTVVRLGTKLNAGGASQFPGPGDPSISAQGLIGAPGIRVYQVWYRNAAAFCTPSTFNLTNGVEASWSP